MADTLQFSIVTPEGVKYQDTIDKVTIPTTTGAITVYPDHTALISILRPGVMTIHKGADEVELSVSGGYFEIRPNSEIFILADTAERAEDIDVSRAEEARKRAEELMSRQHAIDDVDFARLQAKIEKELARVSVGKKYKKIDLGR